MPNESVKPVKGKISESIFSGKTTTIPMADVQHIEKSEWGNPVKTEYTIITKHSQRDPHANGVWLNAIVLPHHEGQAFMIAWCDYRYELENLEENGAQMP